MSLIHLESDSDSISPIEEYYFLLPSIGVVLPKKKFSRNRSRLTYGPRPQAPAFVIRDAVSAYQTRQLMWYRLPLLKYPPPFPPVNVRGHAAEYNTSRSKRYSVPSRYLILEQAPMELKGSRD